MKFKSSVIFMVFVFAIAFFTGCDGTATNGLFCLNDKQKETLKSAREITGTGGEAWELNYTADYKLNDFIDTITANKADSVLECRLTMKNLIAKSSAISPLNRLTNEAPGCSSVMCKYPTGESVLGRNYDLDINSNGATIVIHTAPENGYKSVGVSDGAQFGLSKKDMMNGTANKELLLYAPYYTMDGVNEKGFACSIMVLSEGLCVQDTGKKWMPNTLIVRYLLDKADSVESAIALLEEVDFKGDYLVGGMPTPGLDASFHWALTDKTGDKAVIEYVNGKMEVNRYPLKVAYNEENDEFSSGYPKYPEVETEYLLSTNFFVTKDFNNTKHDSGKWRYQILENQLSENPTPAKEQLRDLMKSAKYLHNDKDYIYELKKQGKDPEVTANWDWITIWTDILNTSDLTLSLWVREKYEVENVFRIPFV